MSSCDESNTPPEIAGINCMAIFLLVLDTVILAGGLFLVAGLDANQDEAAAWWASAVSALVALFGIAAALMTLRLKTTCACHEKPTQRSITRVTKCMVIPTIGHIVVGCLWVVAIFFSATDSGTWTTTPGVTRACLLITTVCGVIPAAIGVLIIRRMRLAGQIMERNPPEVRLSLSDTRGTVTTGA